jgi:hypothetical protein
VKLTKALPLLFLLPLGHASAQQCFLIPGQQIGYTTNSSAVCKADGTKSQDFFGPVFWHDADQNQFFQGDIPIQIMGRLYVKIAHGSGTQWYTMPCFADYLACRNSHSPPWPDNTCERAHDYMVLDAVTLAWLNQADTAGGPLLPLPLFTGFTCPPAATTPPTATRTPTKTPTFGSSPTPAPCNPPFCVSTPTPDLKPTRTVSPVPPVTNVPTAPCNCPTPTPTPCPCPSTAAPLGKQTPPGGCRGSGAVAMLVPLLLLVRRPR